MSHRAAIYRVQVRKQREPGSWRLFGDIDDAGTWLGKPLAQALKALNGKSKDGKVGAKHESPLPGLEKDQVGIAIRSGRSGVTSVLERPGTAPFDRTPDTREAMRTGVLFVLPRGRDVGRLLVHVPEGRSCKGIVENALRHHMSGLGFVLELGPIVPVNALREAVKRDALERVTLIKHDPARADKFTDAAQWGDDEVDRLELSMPSKRHHRLRRDPLQKFLDQPTEANRRQLIEFRDMVFDEVAVTVDMADGTQRTFFVEGREGGHPMTTALNIGQTDRFGATADEISRELRKAAHAVSP